MIHSTQQDYTVDQLEKAMSSWMDDAPWGGQHVNLWESLTEDPNFMTTLNINGETYSLSLMERSHVNLAGATTAIIRVASQLDPRPPLRYFKKYGSFSSWDGQYWDGGMEEVRPMAITRVEYVPLKD